MDVVWNHLDELDKYLRDIDTLSRVEKFIVDNPNPHLKKIKLSYIVLAILALLFLFVIFGIAEEAITNFVGFLFPAYASIRALQTRDKKDDTQWLTYWVVFSLIVVIEDCFEGQLEDVPLFFAVKFVFIIWLFYPATEGATLVYHNVILSVPFLRIDEQEKSAIHKITDEAEKHFRSFTTDSVKDHHHKKHKKSDSDSDSDSDSN